MDWLGGGQGRLPLHKNGSFSRGNLVTCDHHPSYNAASCLGWEGALVISWGPRSLGANSEFQTDLPQGDGTEQFGSAASRNRCIPGVAWTSNQHLSPQWGPCFLRCCHLTGVSLLRLSLVSQDIGTPLAVTEGAQLSAGPATCSLPRGTWCGRGQRLATRGRSGSAGLLEVGK